MGETYEDFLNRELKTQFNNSLLTHPRKQNQNSPFMQTTPNNRQTDLNEEGSTESETSFLGKYQLEVKRHKTSGRHRTFINSSLKTKMHPQQSQFSTRT